MMAKSKWKVALEQIILKANSLEKYEENLRFNM
jgi:hypothetical protein